ncbi:MAG: sigma-70 family RNA polymerase sigma factor [Phycisphaerae bacterium]|nr:sigma-70 family RNA polymerase sigma factor [Phycisphaerae bacterium]
MLEDKLLLLKVKRGSADALRRIYEKYKDDLLALAVALSYDRAIAEDVLHDVFVSFAEYAEKLQLRTSLKSYLSSCVANHVRNLNRANALRTAQLSRAEAVSSDCDGPDRLATSAELSRRIDQAMEQVPYEQREVIVLHLQGGMRFKAIAQSQGVSINTIQSRYRYGLDKLRMLLNGTVEK